MKRNRQDEGFSLLELLVAVGILAMGMSAVGVMLLSSFQADRYNRNVRSGEAFTRYFIERFTAGNLEEITGDVNTKLDENGTAVIRGDKIITQADTNPGTFYCSWTSEVYSLPGKLKRIDLVIGWGKSKSASFPCDRDHADQCPRVMRMTNVYPY